MKRALALAAACLFSAAPSLHAVITEFFWTGQSPGSPILSEAENWSGNFAPTLTGGSETLTFGPSARDFVYLYPNASIYGLNVTDNYYFSGSENTLTLGAGGLTFAPVGPKGWLTFNEYMAVELAAAQTWSISSGMVEVRGPLFGGGALTKTGNGTLSLRYNSSGFSGDITVGAGTLELVDTYGSGVALFESGTGYPIGTGKLIFGAPTATTAPALVVRSESGYDDDWLELGNDVEVNGLLATKNETELHLPGTVTLNTHSTIKSTGDMLVVEGNVGELATGTKLTIDSLGAVVLTGSSNTYSGGTHVANGVLVFGSAAALPAGGTFSNATTGYIGLAGDNVAGTEVATFLGKFDPANTHGTIGFDTEPGLSQHTYNEPIVLTGFAADARLGSATMAILGPNAVITPQGSDYRFGGGGGILTVASKLTGANGVVVDSPAQLPLTVRLLNQTNDFTGNISVTNSALVFTDNQSTSPAPLPAGTFSMSAGSYIGHEDPEVTASSFLAKFSATTPGIIGFDLSPSATATREINLTGVDLSSLTQAALGTSTFLTSNGEISGPGVRFTGTIGAGAGGVHRFAAYKGGALEVAGTLQGSSLVIGESGSLGAFGDRLREIYSTVLISGDNGTGLAGGTTFYGGQLMIGQSNGVVGTDPTNALGSGTLTVAPAAIVLDGEDEPPAPLLSAAQSGIILGNDIVVNTPELNVGGDTSFTLAGQISGSGRLFVGEETNGPFALTLSGNNTYSGGTWIDEDTVLHVNHNNALGTGALSFNHTDPDFASTVVFNTTAPVIGGLSSNEYASLELRQDNTVLTINQPDQLEGDPSFAGSISAGVLDAQNVFQTYHARLVKDGPGTLTLDTRDSFVNHGFFAYGMPTLLPDNTTESVLMEIRNGHLVLNEGFQLSDFTSYLWVNGGALAIGYDAGISNPILVTTGTIAGNGYLSQVKLGASTNPSARAVLAPGFDDQHGRVGFLMADHVTFGAGSVYQWDIASAVMENAHLRDLLSIMTPSTLEITATADNPWIIRPVTLSSEGVNGVLDDVEPGGMYSWTIISYDAITGITESMNPANVVLDLSAWQPGITGTLDVEFTSLTGAGQVMLHFAAVPEPSTYALLGLGLLMIGGSVWRRRRSRPH